MISNENILSIVFFDNKYEVYIIQLTYEIYKRLG